MPRVFQLRCGAWHAGDSPLCFTMRCALFPQRVCCPQLCAMPVQRLRSPEQAQEKASPRKINATSMSPVGDISVATLLRTYTTLDHCQKAEKVSWRPGMPECWRVVLQVLRLAKRHGQHHQAPQHTCRHCLFAQACFRAHVSVGPRPAWKLHE